jgi:hypothetical protein
VAEAEAGARSGREGAVKRVLEQVLP